MTLYWPYDLPNWLFALITVMAMVFPSLVGLVLTRPLIKRLFRQTGNHNDIVSYYFAAVGVFYGLALGLIAVATYQNYSDADGKATKEANAIGSLYRDLDFYPEPLRKDLESQLTNYLRFIIKKEWPAHHEGNFVDGGEDMIERFENTLMSFEPVKEREKITHAEAIESLEQVVQNRAYRLEAVSTALPAVLWGVVVIGAGINIVMTYLFVVDNFALHIILIALFATCLGLLIFLTAAMDNPFRGEFSVSADSYQSVLENVMKQSLEPKPVLGP